MSDSNSVNWYFDEDAERLLAERGTLRSGASRPKPRVRSQVWVALVGIVAVVSASGWLLVDRFIDRQTDRVRSEIGMVVDWESTVWLQGAYDVAVRDGVDPTAGDEWLRWYAEDLERGRVWADESAQRPQMAVESVEFLDGGLVLARIAVEAAEVPGAGRYQEHRLYRNVDGRWLRTDAQADLWGEPRRLETERFRFVYRARDEEAVTELAAIADALHRRIYRTLELIPDAQEESRLVVQVVPSRDRVGIARFIGDKLVILSPELDRVSYGQRAEQTLSLYLAEAITRRASGEYFRSRRRAPELHWVALNDAIQTWLAYEINPLAQGTNWIDIAPLLRYVDEQGMPDLIDLRVARDVHQSWAAAWPLVACQTVIEYGLKTYGPLESHLLLESTARYMTWDELTQALFGVDASAFEAGWQRYLGETYGLQMER